MYIFSLLAHYEKFTYIGPPLDAVELKNKYYKTNIFKSSIGPGSKKASYTKSPEKVKNCRISAAANLV